MSVRILWLALLALLLLVGWLALWPLSVELSHSAAFSQVFLADYVPVQHLFQSTLEIARRVAPGLTGAVLTDPPGAPTYTLAATLLGAVFIWLAGVYLAALIT